MACTLLAIACIAVLVAGIGAPRQDDPGRGGADLRDEVRRLRDATDRLERAARGAEDAARRADDEVRRLRRDLDEMRKK